MNKARSQRGSFIGLAAAFAMILIPLGAIGYDAAVARVEFNRLKAATDAAALGAARWLTSPDNVDTSIHPDPRADAETIAAYYFGMNAMLTGDLKNPDLKASALTDTLATPGQKEMYLHIDPANPQTAIVESAYCATPTLLKFLGPYTLHAVSKAGMSKQIFTGDVCFVMDVSCSMTAGYWGGGHNLSSSYARKYSVNDKHSGLNTFPYDKYTYELKPQPYANGIKAVRSHYDGLKARIIPNPGIIAFAPVNATVPPGPGSVASGPNLEITTATTPRLYEALNSYVEALKTAPTGNPSLGPIDGKVSGLNSYPYNPHITKDSAQATQPYILSWPPMNADQNVTVAQDNLPAGCYDKKSAPDCNGYTLHPGTFTLNHDTTLSYSHIHCYDAPAVPDASKACDCSGANPANCPPAQSQSSPTGIVPTYQYQSWTNFTVQDVMTALLAEAHQGNLDPDVWPTCKAFKASCSPIKCIPNFQPSEDFAMEYQRLALTLAQPLNGEVAAIYEFVDKNTAENKQIRWSLVTFGPYGAGNSKGKHRIPDGGWQQGSHWNNSNFKKKPENYSLVLVPLDQTQPHAVEIKEDLAHVTVDCGTNTPDGVYQGIKQLVGDGHTPGNDQHLILLTDGKATVGGIIPLLKFLVKPPIGKTPAAPARVASDPNPIKVAPGQKALGIGKDIKMTIIGYFDSSYGCGGGPGYCKKIQKYLSSDTCHYAKIPDPCCKEPNKCPPSDDILKNHAHQINEQMQKQVTIGRPGLLE